MAVDEQTRQRVFTRLREALGEEVATTLMAGVPPFDWSEVATKTDLAALGDELRGEMAALGDELRGEMAALGDELRGEMAALRSELRGEMAALRSELRGEMAALRSELRGEMAQLRGETAELGGGLRGEMGELRGEIGRVEARLSTAMATQTRYFVATTVGAVLTTGALAFAAAGLA